MSSVRGSLGVVAAAALLLGGLLVAGYAVWAWGETTSYLDQLEGEGQLVREGSEFDIATFYMTSSGQYAILAVVLAAMGGLVLAVDRIAARQLRGPESQEDAAPPETRPGDDDLDDLLHAME